MGIPSLSPRLLALVSLGLLLRVDVIVAAPPPGPDTLTENSAAFWDTGAQLGSAAVFDDTTRFLIGASSLRYESTSITETRIWAPATKDASWDLSSLQCGRIAFWVYAENPNIGGFENLSPWVRLYSSETDYVEYHSTSEVLTSAIGQWIHLEIPQTGNVFWTRTDVGFPDMSDIRYIEIHADSSGFFGFTIWIDGLTFFELPTGETDLQIVSISRTPRYPRFDPVYTTYEITEPSGFGPYVFSAATGLGSGQTQFTQRWPNNGDPVTYTATVRNRGTTCWNGSLPGTWTVDGPVVEQVSQSVSLFPGDTATFALVTTWDGNSHDIGFTIDVSDDRNANDSLAIDSKSVAFLSYIDKGLIQEFRDNTALFPNAATDDLIDWLNRHMQRFNELFADANCQKRVHYDVLKVLPGSAPDPNINRLLFAIFPFRFHAGEDLRLISGFYDADDDLDYGLFHEQGHQLGLIDLYRLNMPPEQNQVNAIGYTTVAGLMNGASKFISQHSALAMNHWLNQAHGYFGQYLYGIPSEVRLRILGLDGQPLPDAAVKMYQKVERPGLGDVMTNQIKAQGTTDANGEWVLPNVPIDPALVPTTFVDDQLNDNPFGYVAVIGTNGLLLFRVEHEGFVDYAWLDITEVNNAYRLGQTDVAVFERQVLLGGGDLQLCPPPDMTEENADSWASWAQDGTISVSDDMGFTQVGQASLRIDATGGFDNYVRYPGDRLARWDLNGVQNMRVWFYAINTNVFGFQNRSPWIRLGNQDGYFEWRYANYDILNNAIGQWLELVIPIAGDATWERIQIGNPALDDINYIEVHADTWEYGFTLWMDGLVFEPPCETCPSSVPADLDGDTDVDMNDYLTFSNCFNDSSNPPQPNCLNHCADLDGDGDVDGTDFATFVNCFNGSLNPPQCP